MEDKIRESKSLIKDLLKDHKPKTLDKYDVAKLKKKFPELNEYTYVAQPDQILLGKTILYVHLDTEKISKKGLPILIKRGENNCIKFVRLLRKGYKLENGEEFDNRYSNFNPSKYHVFQNLDFSDQLRLVIQNDHSKLYNETRKILDTSSEDSDDFDDDDLE